jgi:hypothetical protein
VDDEITCTPSPWQLEALKGLHALPSEEDDDDDESDFHQQSFSLACELVENALSNYVKSSFSQAASLHHSDASRNLHLCQVPCRLLGGFPLSALRHLCINDQQLFGDASLFALLALLGPQLEHLELEHTGVTPRGVRAIGAVCNRLRVLNLGRLALDAHGIQAVARGCGRTLKELVAFFATDLGQVC